MEQSKLRGRPATILNKRYEAELRAIFPDVKTRRGLLNYAYMFRALQVIRDMVKDGIIGLEYLDNPKNGTYNFGVLRALGKFNDDEVIKSYAREICQLQQEWQTRRTIREWEDTLNILRLKETVS